MQAAPPRLDRSVFGSRVHRGFTLIELLTVIAIIGILAAILVPTVSRVRASARTSTCASNLRQLGAAMHLFAQENRYRLPPSYVIGPAGGDNNWWYYVSPYVGRQMTATWASVEAVSKTGVFRCPEVDPADTANYPANPWVSYKMNVQMRLKNSGAALNVRLGMPLNKIPNPPRTLLVAEGRGHPEFNECDPNGVKSWTLWYPHSNRLNALFVDGHVASYDYGTLSAQWTAIYDF